MTQRNGRIIRQGNRNKEVQVYQYVTEGTFDAYLYQTLENKQKFISQIMTSKSPVRSCDDVDEQALSYAAVSYTHLRRLPPMCWELRSAKCPARSSGKLNARSEPMKEISRQKGAKTMMELNYTKNGDYLIPDIQLSVQEQKPLGKYGRMRRAFLQENNTLLYNHLILTEKLYPHLWEIQETATARMEQMLSLIHIFLKRSMS